MRWRLPSFGRTSRPWEPLFRREHPSDADQRAYAKALLLGCLIGIGVSWQAILSDGQRQHIYRGIGDLAAAAGRVVVPDWTVHADIAQASEVSVRRQIPAPRQRLAIPPQPAPAPAVVIMTVPAEAAVAPLPERLALAEKEPANDVVPVAPAMPALELELVFDVNSSFLGPAAIGELRRKLRSLPNASQYVVELRATVSDEGIKEASATEAQRYNRWLAERRLGRVRDLLQQYIQAKLVVNDGYLPHDPTRRIIVSARPQS